MNLEQLKEGRFSRAWTVWDEDFEDDFERKEDVTAEVRELVRAYEASVREGTRLAAELKDLKIRKWWDEIEIVTNDGTGQTAVIRTHYQLEMKAMRLEVSPELMRMAGPKW